MLTDIREDLLNESAPLVNTLRKARVFAHELQSSELREWVMSELDGYADSGNVPDYRRVPLPVFGNFHGSFQRRMGHVLVSTFGLEEPFKELADVLVVTEGVASIEEMLLSGEQEFQRRIPPEITQLMREKLHMSGGMVLFETYQRIPRGVLSGILDTIKNRLLEFVLELQGKAVMAATSTGGRVEPDEIRNAINVTIYGSNNVVAAGDNIHQVVEHVQAHNMESLLEHLKGYEVYDEDLADLVESIKREPVAAGGNFGPKVSESIGKMLSKAASGIWGVGVERGSQILNEALRAYYGL